MHSSATASASQQQDEVRGTWQCQNKVKGKAAGEKNTCTQQCQQRCKALTAQKESCIAESNQAEDMHEIRQG